MKMDKQKENVSNLFKLIKENPDLPIVPMVATECVCGDEHGYWKAEWGSAKVTKYWMNEEGIYQYDDFSELVDEWVETNYDDEKYKNLTDEEIETIAEEVVNGYDWVDAIMVYINEI